MKEYSVKRVAKSVVPILGWLLKYKKKWLIGDFISGITLGLIIVPQSLAYCKIIGLPLEHGLYSSLIPTIIYGFLGTTREISVGPTAVLSLVIKEVMEKISLELDMEYLNILPTLTLIVGFLFFLISILRLAKILDLIPQPVMMGFTSGAALTIMLTQVPKILGMSNINSNGMTLVVIKDIILNFVNVNIRDLIIGVSSLAVLFLMKCVKIPHKLWPYVLIMLNGICVILFSIIVFFLYYFNEGETISIVKTIPSGLQLLYPSDNIDVWISSVKHCYPILLVGMLEHISISKTFSKNFSYDVDLNQEILAIGVGNFLSSFLGAFPSVASFSRSAAQSKSGVHSPLSSIFTGLFVLSSIGFLTPLLYYIPLSTLAAVIFTAALSLITRISIIKKLYKVSKIDSLMFLFTLLLTFLVGTEWAIIISVIVYLLILIYKISRPKFTFDSIGQPNDNFLLNGCYIIKFAGPLVFSNSEYFKAKFTKSLLFKTRPHPDSILLIADLWNNKIREKCKLELDYLKLIIFDFTKVTFLDFSAIDALNFVHQYCVNYTNEINFEIIYIIDNEDILDILYNSNLIQKPSNIVPNSQGCIITISERPIAKRCESLDEAIGYLTTKKGIKE